MTTPAPSRWYTTEQGTFAPDALCTHCGHGDGQVLGGGSLGVTIRCRCSNPDCRKNFLHVRPETANSRRIYRCPRRKTTWTS